MSNLSAIILAAGKGTRMNSERAKVTFNLAEKPIIQRVVNTALKANCSKIYVVVGYQKESVIGSLHEDSRLIFVEQPEQLGTGHAVMMVEPVFSEREEDVFILCGDVPLLKPETLKKLYNEHCTSSASCTILTSIMDNPGNYGRILRNASGEITGIVEFKDASEEQKAIKEWNTGIYCFKAGDMFDALKQISSTNNQNEYYLTDVVSVLAKQGKKISSVILDNPIEAAGVNSQEQLAELEDLFIAEICRYWLNNGVVIHNPRTVYIGEEVAIETDVEIGQNSIILGKSELRKGAYIGPNCYIEDTVLCDNSLLEGYNILVNAHIPEGHILEFGEKTIEDLDYE
ncbi:MAG: sugar phosphate nucleotidyltransferase [Candidatus Cloacimonadaceae bacterium]|jgi:bifunctional UDP-N-acetylglucosamine pyrophosphorylase/glucosamine-1-phosphate N-acetyltransferase|nr:NTP transferase domain-containing protein [Candidatus Cloacimonadota bacterium]MDD5624202.1 sugar phosphate nucleotidyltransferase [Candidatus Cloacimonadota bacterium]MDY0111550.1 sugar phosphate nucleotidyltransferase [Candidatus Syntrophosphaera sp.]